MHSDQNAEVSNCTRVCGREPPPLLDCVQLLLRGKLNLYRQNRTGKPNAALANLALAKKKTTTTTSNTDEHLHPPQATRVTPASITIASGTCEATRHNAMCVHGFP